MSTPRKVLIVIGQLEVGGTEQHLLSTLPKLSGESLEISVYALRGGGRLEPEFVAAGIRIVSPAHHSRRWVGLLRTAIHFMSVLRGERPDVLHFYLPEAYLLGGLCSLLAPPCARLMSRRSLNNYQRKSFLVRPIERILHRRMDGVLANSQAVLRQLEEEGVKKRLSAVVYNGVAIPRTHTTKSVSSLRDGLGLGADTVILVMVANLIPYKGHADLLEALGIATTQLPQAWTLLLVGADNGNEADLRAHANRLGVGSHIRWLGRQDNVHRYLAVADVALLTSHEEGFSNAILEAMAHELPLIVTDVGGNPEAVVDGETGIVVPPEDPVALAAAIVRLVSAPNLCREMARAGQQRAADVFQIEQCVNAYRRIYLGIARRQRVPIDSLIRAETL